MKGFELGSMTDAYHRRFLELPGHKFHQLIATLWIKGRGCLVKHNNVWPMEQNSREPQALFLPTRQGLIPRTFFVEALDEVA
jgi:hypothetical protein